MAKAAAQIYTPDSFSNMGPFKGIVLRVKEQSEKPEPATWLSSFFGDGLADAAGVPTSLVEIKVRVPEVHAMLPIPEQLGDAEGPHQKTINMYPTFIAQSLAVEAPMPGDLVWVDWGNRQSWTDPVYVRPVKESRGMGAGGPGGGAAFPCAPEGAYSAAPASGDSTAGKNLPAKPHVGLPRLKRKPKVEGTNKFVFDANVDPDATTNCWKAVVNGAQNFPPGVSIIAPLTANGPNDEQHNHGKRSTLIWYSNAVDFKQDWELIYWFHGLEGFSRKTFADRVIPQLKKAADQGRNFVFVKPELPWSKRGTKKKRGPRQMGAWLKEKKDTWGGDFSELHMQVMAKLGPVGQPAFISCYGQGAGGSALAQAAKSGAFHDVKPNRIFFSEADSGWDYGYGGALGTVWEKYASRNSEVWLTAMTTEGRTARKLATDFFESPNNVGKIKAPRQVFHIKTSKSVKWCGNNALSVVADELQKRTADSDHKAVAEAASAQPNSETAAENAGADVAAQEATDAVHNPPVDPDAMTDAEAAAFLDAGSGSPPRRKQITRTTAGAQPPPQGPATSPSQVSKQSTTAQAPTWTTAPAQYKYTPVRIKDYGDKSVVASQAATMLEGIEVGVSVHKLAAARYRALKKAALSAGFSGFKAVKGWGPAQFTSWAQYKAHMNATYAEIDPATGQKGDNGIELGRKYQSYHSNHETGLAFDVDAHGVFPVALDPSQMLMHIGVQKTQPLFKWLKNNAHRFGFTPHNHSPWHWEVRLPYAAWASGQEFTSDYAVRVTDVGQQTGAAPNQLPGGGPPGAGGQQQQCVYTGGPGGAGGGGGGGAGGGVGGFGSAGYTPGATYNVAAGSPLGSRLIAVAPPKNQVPPVTEWGIGVKEGKKRWNELVDSFVLHETAGWPKSGATLAYRSLPGKRSKYKEQRPKPPKNMSMPEEPMSYPAKEQKPSEQCVHYWCGGDGVIAQMCHPSVLAYHGRPANFHSCGIEVCCRASGGGAQAAKTLLKQGHHVVSSTGHGDIATEPGMEIPCKVTGHVKTYHLCTLAQCVSTWDLFISLRTNPPPPTLLEGQKRYSNKGYPWKSRHAQRGTPRIEIPITFPAMGGYTDKFFWGKWAGKPSRSVSRVEAWWKKHVPAGIYCHARISNHHDGLQLEYYFFARARGLGPIDAFYAMVGGMCSGTLTGEGGCWTPMPEAMVALGKSKYPAAWLNGSGGNAKSKYDVKKGEWRKLAAANPQWFAQGLAPRSLPA
jgi:hypothetical protein